MKFLHPNKELAEEMILSMSSYIESNHMLSQSIEDIMNNFESWFIGIGQDQSLQGFFCYRRPHENYAEIGSVLALQSEKGIGKSLIQKFETERRTRKDEYGCAITKNRTQFFINQTQGKLLTTFPEWYQKSKGDKNFILWS